MESECWKINGSGGSAIVIASVRPAMQRQRPAVECGGGIPPSRGCV